MDTVRSSHILETPTKLGSHGKNKLLTEYELIVDNIEQGKHAEVFFLETPNKTHKLAMKRQVIQQKDSNLDRSYREFRILEQLGNLKTDTFVCLVDWFKIHPPLLPGDTDEDEEEEYLHMVLEFVEQTLHSRTKEGPFSIDEFKSILFEILFALHIAQRELEFNHNDLHHRNILLKKMEPGTYRLHEDGKNKWYTSGYAAKLCDFGLSRIKIKETGEIISSDKYVSFLPNTDVEKLASDLKFIKVTWGDSNDQSIFKGLKKLMNEGYPPAKLIEHEFFKSLRDSRESKVRTYQSVPLKKSLMFSPVTIKKLQKKGVSESDSLVEQMESLSLNAKKNSKALNNKSNSLSEITNTESSKKTRSKQEIKEKPEPTQTRLGPVTRSSKRLQDKAAQSNLSVQPLASRRKGSRVTEDE